MSDYLDGALDAAVARRLEQHLGGCPTCPPLYASLVGVRDALDRAGRTRRDPDSVVPPHIVRRILTLNPAAHP